VEILSLLRESAGEYPCPGCERPLADCGMELIEQGEDSYTVEVTCARCEIGFLVVLRLEAADQPAAEAPLPPIGPDELLDVHQALHGHQGPLSELFAPV